jgi:hypothetical protein
MKNKYFAGASEWQESDVHKTGLPRPFATPTRKDLAKKVPIPWQSEDRFQSLGHLGLNEKNEDLVYENNLCPYCGIKINDEETVVRWYTCNLILVNKNDRWVYSDLHPFHLECMEQGRIFCPHMRGLQDLDFETGTYKKLKQNAINDVIKSKELRNEKIIQKDIQS